MSAATPEVDESPEAGKGGGKVLQPDCVGTEPVAEDVGEAGNELVFDGGRAHQARVIRPGRGVDEEGESGGKTQGGGESGEELVAARNDNPEGEYCDEGQK